MRIVKPLQFLIFKNYKVFFFIIKLGLGIKLVVLLFKSHLLIKILYKFYLNKFFTNNNYYNKISIFI